MIFNAPFAGEVGSQRGEISLTASSMLDVFCSQRSICTFSLQECLELVFARPLEEAVC